jgi:hypothetical protein
MGGQVQFNEKSMAFCRPLLLAAAVGLLVGPAAGSQTNSGATDNGCSGSSGSVNTNAETSASVISAAGSEDHYTWIEEFEGSSNTEGQVMLLDSSAGYVFGRHVLVDGGIPVYFVRANTTSATGTSTTNSFTALGDIYGQFRLSFPNPMLNFRTQLTGRAPTGSTSDGISTGHATYDWTNRIDRRFGNWTPFLEVGLADSIPDAFVYKRSFASYGNLAHFQLGAQYRVTQWFGVAASAFDVAPWGTQTIDSRVQKTKVTGGSNLAADNGFSVGADLSPARAIDFTVGYSRSTHYDLNTISFGVVVNMREVLRRPGL